MLIKIVEQDDVTLKVAALNGGVELRLLADDQRIEHRLRLDIETARELVACLQRLLDARA
jgi:hypothetical protein